jgi:hypothetical protein
MSAGVIPSARRVLRAHYVRGAGRILDNREYPQWSASHLPSNAAPVAGLAARADPSALRHVMQLTARLLQHLCEAIEGAHVRDTHELDVAAARWAHAHDAYPAPLNYHGFPKAICASVNEIAVHGVPDDRPLRARRCRQHRLLALCQCALWRHGALCCLWRPSTRLRPKDATLIGRRATRSVESLGCPPLQMLVGLVVLIHFRPLI